MDANATNDGGQQPTFGYHPATAEVDVALSRGHFERALVAGTHVGSIATRVAETRVSASAASGLQAGVYWFQGAPGGDLVVQVAGGKFPGGAIEVATDSLSENHVLYEIWNVLEDLWGTAEPVPSPKFEHQDAAITRPGGIDVTISDRRYIQDEWSYSVVTEGRQRWLLESNLAPRPVDDDPRAWVAQEPTPATFFSATLTRAKLEGRFANTLFSFRATRTLFRPYQFKPVMKLLQTGKARLLIADEVGLGKTIEAGLIWTELEARREADRVLIVCPSSLLGKWQEEMVDRFDFELEELDSRGLDRFLDRHLANRLPRRYAYICSLERLRTWGGLETLSEIPPSFDLVVIDEAHSMRNTDTRSYALGSQISEWADNLVFLTATPINLRQDDLLNLLELLAPEDYADLADLQARLEPNSIINEVAARLTTKWVSGHSLKGLLAELRHSDHGKVIMQRPDYTLLTELLSKDQLSPRDIVIARRYLADLNTLSTVITRTKKIEVDDLKAKRQEDRQEVNWTDEERAFYDEYLQWCKDRADYLGSPLYFAMQMPLRLASACLPMARRAVLDPDGFGDLTDEDGDDVKPFRLEPHPALIAAAKALPEGVDTKFDMLLEVLRALHGKQKQALLFTHSRPTLAYLQQRLCNEFRVAVMHGGVDRQNRRQIMADFRAGRYDFVLANRVASEGLDFEFCSAVISYCIPWNPMEIEQRIGRIDRIGQKEEAIAIINFVNQATIDERILVRLLDRIKIFEASIGSLEPIISETAQSIIKAGFDFKLTEKQREQKIHEALTAVEEQRKGVRDVTDASSSLLISNDVDVAGLEQDLIRTGRYIGQRELALLIDDWARIDQAPPLEYGKARPIVNLRGNPAMAERVTELARRQQRTGAETHELATSLRDELPLTLSLDQEHARETGTRLLTATSPLVMAAVSVPGHRQARFASVKVEPSSPDSIPGTYLVVLAKAVSKARGGDEIWGEAINDEGTNCETPVDDLLAALAEGSIEDVDMPALPHIGYMADVAVTALGQRHSKEQVRRRNEFDALKESRQITLRDQSARKVVTLRKRLQTARERGRSESILKGIRTQISRAQQKLEAQATELRDQQAPELTLENLAACVVVVGEHPAEARAAA